MALPPEPIERLLPYAHLVVAGEVAEVLEARDDAPKIAGNPGDADLGVEAGSQLVRLKIREVLKGQAPSDHVTVEKPVAPYLLEAGVPGPFLLTARPDGVLVIIGRYGPRFYEIDDVRRLIAAAGRT